MNKKEIFTELRDKFKDVRIEIDYTKGAQGRDEYDELKKTYMNMLSEAMDKTDSFDAYYLKNIPQRNGTGYYMFYHLVEDNAPLKDCFTALTFLLKNEKRSPGAFSDAVNAGIVYQVLDRVCKLL